MVRPKTIGKIGQALKFDGDDDYVNCGNDTSLDMSEEMTLSILDKTIN